MGIKLRLAEPRVGHVRLRRKFDALDWSIETFGTAKNLRHLQKWSETK